MPINTSGITLSDRVKELSYTGGAGNFSLGGAAQGFSSFSSLYSSGDVVFYAITDGIDYEVGSGVYHYVDGAEDELERFSFASTNSDAKVNFPLSTVKEVFVTYPADFSVYTAAGLSSDFKTVSKSGVAFWQTPNILNYDSELIWDSENNRLGISNVSPEYAVDIGGADSYSHIRVSGMTVSSSGLNFPSGNGGLASYMGGRQVEHFLRNDLIDGEGGLEQTNIGELIQVSGAVSEYLGLVKQEAGQFLAGPPSGCEPGCSPDYPSFRQITVDDLPGDDFANAYSYVTQHGEASKSGVAIFQESGVIAYDPSFIWNSGLNRLGIGFTDPAYPLSVNGDALVSGTLYVSEIDGLTAGSGLELKDNLTFNVGNVFDVAVSGSSATVSQADTIAVSGVSGVNTSMISDGLVHTILVDANELSGVLNSKITGTTYYPGSGLELTDVPQANSFNVNINSGVAQFANNLPSGGAIFNFVSGVSGALALTGHADSGILLSGVNNQTIVLSPPSGYLDFLPSGEMDVTNGQDRILVWDHSDAKWEWTYLNDINHKFGSATGGQVNEYSYKTITVNSGDTGWSNWLTSDIAAGVSADKLNLVAGSGIVLHTSHSDAIDATSGIRISNTIALQNFVDSATGVAVTPSAVFAVSGFLGSQSYWDGNLFADSGLYFPSGNFASFGGGDGGGYTLSQGQTQSVIAGAYDDADIMGNNNNQSVILGYSAAVGAEDNTSAVIIGEHAGFEALRTSKSVYIGFEAGANATVSVGVVEDGMVCIGEQAGSGVSNAHGAIMIGARARSATSQGQHSIYLGTDAGFNNVSSGNLEILPGHLGNSLETVRNHSLNIANVITGNWADQQLAIGSGTHSPEATLDIYPNDASTVGVIVSGVPASNASLQQWRAHSSTGSQIIGMSVNNSGILIFDTAIPSGLAPVKSLFVDTDSSNLMFRDVDGAVFDLTELGTAASTYTPPAVMSFEDSSGTLGVTASLATPENKYVLCKYNLTDPYVTISVPHSSFWNPAVGTEVMFEQTSGVNVSVLSSGVDVSVNSAYTRTTAGQYSVVSIKKIDSNTWTLTGDVQ
jgi:hypothetical protein